MICGAWIGMHYADGACACAYARACMLLSNATILAVLVDTNSVIWEANMYHSASDGICAMLTLQASMQSVTRTMSNIQSTSSGFLLNGTSLRT